MRGAMRCATACATAASEAIALASRTVAPAHARVRAPTVKMAVQRSAPCPCIHHCIQWRILLHPPHLPSASLSTHSHLHLLSWWLHRHRPFQLSHQQRPPHHQGYHHHRPRRHRSRHRPNTLHCRSHRLRLLYQVQRLPSRGWRRAVCDAPTCPRSAVCLCPTRSPQPLGLAAHLPTKRHGALSKCLVVRLLSLTLNVERPITQQLPLLSICSIPTPSLIITRLIPRLRVCRSRRVRPAVTHPLS
mmetsp:Transcript_63041/g.124590  ORF Transcript_63041/g.124590 Transcript_63041/m.124590 type:complete len:245 (+) Transcript_63041:691-1425(+)